MLDILFLVEGFIVLKMFGVCNEIFKCGDVINLFVFFKGRIWVCLYVNMILFILVENNKE